MPPDYYILISRRKPGRGGDTALGVAFGPAKRGDALPATDLRPSASSPTTCRTSVALAYPA